MPKLQSETKMWFVLNYVAGNFQAQAKKVVDRFNSTHEASLELFAPTYIVQETKDGQVRMKSVSLTFHYVFVRGTLGEVKQLCSLSNGFSFLIDRSRKERYAVVSERDMSGFKNIARAYKNCLPYFSLEDVDLEDGDLVEVVSGDFSGLIGTYMPKAKSNAGNIVLNVYNKVGTIAFNVKAGDVRVLEFSGKGTRANDQIDAIIPHVLKGLRLLHEDKELPANIASKLAVFCGRMEIVRMNNRKLEAKLQLLLYAANYILGRIENAEMAKTKFERVKDAVTNKWTTALVALIFSIINSDNVRLQTAISEIDCLTPSSKSQIMVSEELEHYISLN